MTPSPLLRVACGQLDLAVGDVDRNAQKIADIMSWAEDRRADALLLPELAISGYPPEDLLGSADFVRACMGAVHKLGRDALTCTTLLGTPWEVMPGPAYAPAHDGRQRTMANGLLPLRGGRATTFRLYAKRYLPNYSVFDEERWFVAGVRPGLLDLPGQSPVGLAICEDIWSSEVASQLARRGVKVLLVANASPFDTEKQAVREKLVTETAHRHKMAVVYVNTVGGQDELVFDGASLVVGADGKIAYRASSFNEERFVVVVNPDTGMVVDAPVSHTRCSLEHQVWCAITGGISGYLSKTGTADVVVGLSGGIDSAVVATAAADALGPEHVWGVGMPGPFSSEGSVADAEELARRLGIRFSVLPIAQPYQATLEVLRFPGAPFEGTGFSVAEENIQARLRGLYLMAITNKHGGLVLTTSNKSEAAVGYTTLYGDLAGGYAPLKDVPKTFVYRLARWRNTNPGWRGGDAPIPDSTIEKPPSAELAPGQRDDQNLPPYEVLDVILEAYIEHPDRSLESIFLELVERGLVADTDKAIATVQRVVQLVDGAEYKRRQSPPGIRITPLAFGRDRRLPIANRWRPGSWV